MTERLDYTNVTTSEQSLILGVDTFGNDVADFTLAVSVH